MTTKRAKIIFVPIQDVLQFMLRNRGMKVGDEFHIWFSHVNLPEDTQVVRAWIDSDRNAYAIRIESEFFEETPWDEPSPKLDYKKVIKKVRVVEIKDDEQVI